MRHRWRVIRRVFDEGERYLLQKEFYDASKPYWLTRRIFRARGLAIKKLREVRLDPNLIKN